jgi:hypothetical protein
MPPGRAPSWLRASTAVSAPKLAATLDRGRARRRRDQVQAEISRITRPRWLTRVLSTELTGDGPAGIGVEVVLAENRADMPE